LAIEYSKLKIKNQEMSNSRVFSHNEYLKNAAPILFIHPLELSPFILQQHYSPAKP